MGQALRIRIGRSRLKSTTADARTTNGSTISPKPSKTSTAKPPTPTVRVSGVDRKIESGPRGGKFYWNKNGGRTALNRDGKK